MPKFSTKTPAYRRHHRGSAFVQIEGRRIYLGKYGTEASKAEYRRLIAQWAGGQAIEPPRRQQQPYTVADLILGYWRHAQAYYRKNGQPTDHLPSVKAALRRLRQLCAAMRPDDIVSADIELIRHQMIEQKLSRKYINDQVFIICRCLRWGVSQGKVQQATLDRVVALGSLKKGRTDAVELAPIKPVADAVVNATLPYLPEVVAAMVQIQRLTCARPGEVCALRPCDIDRSAETWVYRPSHHKTEHAGRDRLIEIGPRAQAILTPFLQREATAHCFSPRESEQQRYAQLHQCRQTPLMFGNRPGSNRTSSPRRTPGMRYSTQSYRRAIHRAIDKANRDIRKKAEQQQIDPALLPHWNPNQLRHTAATEIRAEFGLEAAQIALGHSRADVTEIYAERDQRVAKSVAQKLG